MRIVYEYSHLGGAEILATKFPAINREISEAISEVSGNFKTKISDEKGKIGKALYAPKLMNGAFRDALQARGFRELKRKVTPDIPGYTVKLRAGFKQIDFAKDRVLTEVQFGKYFAMFYDMAKLEYFYRQNLADVGVEIVPSHLLQSQMSSGVGRGEMLITDIIGLQRQFPSFPVKVILIEP